MPEGQRHLTHTGRCRIHATGKSGHSNAAIARRPGRDRTTVWREVRRSCGRWSRRGWRRAGAPSRSRGGCALGPSDGGPAVDPAARPRRPEGGRPALAASPPPGQEVGPEGWRPRGPRAHPGASGARERSGTGRQEPGTSGSQDPICSRRSSFTGTRKNPDTPSGTANAQISMHPPTC